MSDDVFAVGLPESFGPDDVLVRMGATTACPCGSNAVVATGAPGAPLSVRCAQCGTALPATTASIAAMWPTMPEAEPTVDPRTVIDDRVTHLLNTEGEQFKARMWQQLSIRGMNDGRAHSILRKLGLTQ